LGHELEFLRERAKEEIWGRENGGIMGREVGAEGSDCREDIS